MDLREICTRKEQIYTQEESLFLIKEYVKERRGVDITPQIETRLPLALVQDELLKMSYMASVAQSWFLQNKFK